MPDNKSLISVLAGFGLAFVAIMYLAFGSEEK